MNRITHEIDKLKQENLRLKNENRVLKKALEKKEQTIESLRFSLLERDGKMQTLEDCYKTIKGKLYE